MAFVPHIGVIDYGLGNMRSVYGALGRIGVQFSPVQSPRDLSGCTHLILPGVGAFSQGMRNLHERTLVEPLVELVGHGEVFLLGICLGMQLLAKSSTEFGDCDGLNLIDATVDLLQVERKDMPLPHVGWNEVQAVRSNPLTGGLEHRDYYYHVHSYVMKPRCEENVLARSEYGENFATIVGCGNVYGTQFHPEKSQVAGLNLLRNFSELRAG
ncbi:imidazole glycerol phosphate synthase subunit HisH [Thalassospira alkalitolerans]|uniref:imidazole glycerol phosphate synthase subunit HisH n=1 Tax=Thalassospira alkalitolerans TaxID=1293890 RepID=UPI003C6EC539|tara:strand:- start:35571 stop:36206 length:636 start_codon:yes stop_codon:yes gene_type:complete